MMRVIAGTLKGRILKAPRSHRTRPTADRVKEALFSILGPLDGVNVLDLYAGTGALGIEALSRGASHAVFVESSRESIKCLTNNLAALDLTECTDVIHAAVERSLKEIARRAPYDLVFCDPPWLKVTDVWELLAKSEWEKQVAPGGLLVLEHPAATAAEQCIWRDLVMDFNRAWGDTAVTILKMRDR